MINNKVYRVLQDLDIGEALPSYEAVYHRQGLMFAIDDEGEPVDLRLLCLAGLHKSRLQPLVAHLFDADEKKLSIKWLEDHGFDHPLKGLH